MPRSDSFPCTVLPHSKGISSYPDRFSSNNLCRRLGWTAWDGSKTKVAKKAVLEGVGVRPRMVDRDRRYCWGGQQWGGGNLCGSHATSSFSEASDALELQLHAGDCELPNKGAENGAQVLCKSSPFLTMELSFQTQGLFF